MRSVNIGVAGCLGRMGQELVKAIIKNNHINFSGGFEKTDHKDINKNISKLINVNTNYFVASESKKVFLDSDVVIDFTTPESTLQNVLIASQQNTPIVIGTTGLGKKIMDEIKNHSNKIPILQSSNMSFGINLLFHLVEQAATALKDVDYDIEISETHHKHKIDAPSGTALSLGEFAAKGRKEKFDNIKEFDRTKVSSERKIGNIGFAVTRGGEIPGEHTISFIGNSDRIDILHKTYDRSIFVNGAIEAAIFISDKSKGLYSMDDVIKSK